MQGGREQTEKERRKDRTQTWIDLVLDRGQEEKNQRESTEESPVPTQDRSLNHKVKGVIQMSPQNLVMGVRRGKIHLSLRVLLNLLLTQRKLMKKIRYVYIINKY